MASSTVCVIIAARNAEATIGRAIHSALREKRVGEVVVVDDGSHDATLRNASGADDGSGRLRLIGLGSNHGPAFARNRAIAASRAPLIAILDADDFFLRGRFEDLLDGEDWDFVADNIVFIDERRAAHAEPVVPQFESAPRFLDMAGLVDGNISRRGASRGEIGFLKPVMRRAFLDRHGLRYNEALRLGDGRAAAFSLAAEVEGVELTGPELIATARIGAQRIMASLPPRSRAVHGRTQAFAFDEEALHLFDPETGTAYRATAMPPASTAP